MMSRLLRGAIWGLIVSFIVGFIISIISTGDIGKTFYQSFIYYGLPGIIIGAILGALAEAEIKDDKVEFGERHASPHFDPIPLGDKQ